MDRPSRDPKNVSLALIFLRDRAGMRPDEIGSALGAAAGDVANALCGRTVDWDESQRSALDAVVATQSLLLDGYTPGAAAAWFRTPSEDLDGRIPLCEMTDPCGTARVLRAAASRMSR